ncbi:MAG TPA: ribosome small subunit-dependent GTPase A [Burkholderiales bacterium]|nr:ribosome small subunit-dependent GTPase A [Burkholderiales bacterium]
MAQKKRGDAAREPGFVVAVHARRYRVELDGGREIDCVTRGRKSDVAVGDRVEIAPTGDGGVIEAIGERRTLFYRSDARRQKLIAANATQVVMVVAPSPPYSEDLVNRCLVGAEHGGIPALIALNKVDLPESAEAMEKLKLYESLGYRVVALSAKRDLSPLREHLGGNVSVLVGQSGMGKSTIVNGLAPEAAARTAEISVALNTGKHTTTHAELYHLAPGSDIIDSPGLQEFGLHHLTPEDAAQAFVEFRPWLGDCRFRDCRHLAEPDCAIHAAKARGEIAEGRYASYARLAEELSRKRAAWDT